VAIAHRFLRFFGPKSNDMHEDDIELLGNMVCALLCHEIDKAASLLLELNNEDIDGIGKAADKLYNLCQITLRED